MQKFFSKKAVVEAIQWDPDSPECVSAEGKSLVDKVYLHAENWYYEGMAIEKGDWVVYYNDGTCQSMSNDVFKEQFLAEPNAVIFDFTNGKFSFEMDPPRVAMMFQAIQLEMQRLIQSDQIIIARELPPGMRPGPGQEPSGGVILP